MNQIRYSIVAIFFLLSVCQAGQPAAKPLCNTTQECENIISAAKIRLEGLSKQDSAKNEVIAKSGAVFKRRDNLLVDPSGKLAWGKVGLVEGVVEVKYSTANNYCHATGGRLPTAPEYIQLAKYLGDGSSEGYSPYAEDGKTEMFRGLATIDSAYWAAQDPKTERVYAFSGIHGWVKETNFGWSNIALIGEATYHPTRMAFRCVFDVQ